LPANATLRRRSPCGPVPEHERPLGDLEQVAVLLEPARLALARAVAVAVLPQLVGDLVERELQPRAQLDRLRVDARGQREAASFELVAHAEIEIGDEADREERNREEGVADIAPELRAVGLDLAKNAAAEHRADFTYSSSMLGIARQV